MAALAIASQPAVRGRALGLELLLERSLAGLPVATGPPAGPPVALREVEPEAIEALWEGAGAERLLAARRADGRRWLTIERGTGGGSYLMRGDSYGRFLLAADGSSLLCSREPGPLADASWEAFLLNQALPLAALLRGHEVLHASAVALGGRAAAVLAPSGGGKSSLAARLVLRGAGFLTDDVLAICPTAGGVLAHPGPASLKLRPDQAADVPARGRTALGPVNAAGPGGARHETAPVPRPHTLAAAYLIDRAGGASDLTFDPVDDPRLLLGASFNAVLRTPERLRRHLEVCALLSRSARVRRVSVPPGVEASRLAEALERDMLAEG
jgi:hypothetical protein